MIAFLALSAFNLANAQDCSTPITSQVLDVTDFSAAGRYIMTVTTEDDNGNEGSQDFTVVIYDTTNVTAPVFTVKDLIFFDTVSTIILS